MNKQFFIKRTMLLLLAAISLTACRSVDYDNPKPTYMDSIAGISLQAIHSIQYYVGPLSHSWIIYFANNDKPFFVTHDRKCWEYWDSMDSNRVVRPLSGYSNIFFEHHGITENQLVQIMEYVSANGIPLLCGPSYPRWEESFATDIYEYRDDTLHERLLLFDTKGDSIRFFYKIECNNWSARERGYARSTNCLDTFIEYLYDDNFFVTIRFSADTSMCLSVYSDSIEGRSNPWLNSRYPMKKLP